MKIALLGTRGVPARYGGFETAVEEIGSRLAGRGHQVTVYCRNDGQRERHYLGMRLVNLPALRQRSLETLTHTGLSTAHLVTRLRPDAAVLFNAANAPYLPVLRAARVPTALHLDGLEWQRAKWAGAGARYYRWAERYSARHADELIADARAISEHVRATYGRASVFIPYGAPVIAPGSDRLAELDLVAGGYHLVVARMEPENHVREIVEGYVGSTARLPLVVVGDAPYAHEYARAVRSAAAGDTRVRLVGAVWDQGLLDQLYAGSASYLHGHSVGGTNPSLLRALGAAAPVTAFDVSFNHEVTGGHARFFAGPAESGSAVVADERDPATARVRGAAGQSHARETYEWDEVTGRYEELFERLRARASA